jgi:hypothetical protein
VGQLSVISNAANTTKFLQLPIYPFIDYEKFFLVRNSATCSSRKLTLLTFLKLNLIHILKVLYAAEQMLEIEKLAVKIDFSKM